MSARPLALRLARWFRSCAWAIWVGTTAWAVTALAAPQTSELKYDENLTFFPSSARRLQGGGGWECEVRGCIFEPEKRGLILGTLREALALSRVQMTNEEAAIFAERARLFMVDNKRGRAVVVRVGETSHALGKSRADGRFAGVLRLSDADIPATDARMVQFHAVLPEGDPRRFPGQINLVDERGVTVISDIDDTIKITGVSDRQTLLRRTFLEPFKPHPGMAELYQAWANQSGAQFCYVSASPWQLFLPLSEFINTNRFPAGAFYLKEFRWKNQTLLNLFENPQRHKSTVIQALFKRYPQRQFVLIGDAGERDPEIYAELARRHPVQVACILIRDPSGEAPNTTRYQEAFRGLPPALWRVFHAPGELIDSCPPFTGR